MARPVLTRSRIVAAGVTVVSEVGLPALDMRTVARRVKATATGVQRHVSPTELVESVVAEIMSSMPPLPARGNWSRRLRLWATETRAWLTEYPGLAAYLLANRWDVPVALDRLEEVVELLDGTELGGAHSVMSGITLYWFVLSSADLDGSPRVIGGDASQLRNSEPLGRWPRLSAHINNYSAAAAHAQFTFGLDLLIEGIQRRFGDGATHPKIGPGESPRS
jgi:AcrR family transcriptional regulator